MTISLIVPVLKRFDLFAELINSIDYPVLPIVIDNWRGNRGVSAAWNLGMYKSLQAGNQYAIIVNDDVIFDKDVICELVKSIKETDAVMVSPYAENSEYFNDPENWIDYCCFIVDIKKLIKNVGWFDENFYPAYFEDNDMRRRIKLSGLKTFSRKDLKITHAVSATQFADPNNPVTSNEAFNKNYEYFIKKWGGEPYREIYTNPFNNTRYDIKYWEKNERTK